jgi:hypothetical protein
VCTGGKRSGPSEDGGVTAFQQQRDRAPWRAQELWDQIADGVRAQDRLALRDLLEEIAMVQTWLTVHQFDRRKVNRQLRQYAEGNEHGTFFTEGGEDIRELPQFLNPEAEHILDWFHLTMRLTVWGQRAKGLAGLEQTFEDKEEPEKFDLVGTEKQLEKLK